MIEMNLEANRASDVTDYLEELKKPGMAVSIMPGLYRVKSRVVIKSWYVAIVPMLEGQAVAIDDSTEATEIAKLLGRADESLRTAPYDLRAELLEGLCEALKRQHESSRRRKALADRLSVELHQAKHPTEPAELATLIAKARKVAEYEAAHAQGEGCSELLGELCDALASENQRASNAKASADYLSNESEELAGQLAAQGNEMGAEILKLRTEAKQANERANMLDAELSHAGQELGKQSAEVARLREALSNANKRTIQDAETIAYFKERAEKAELGHAEARKELNTIWLSAENLANEVGPACRLLDLRRRELLEAMKPKADPPVSLDPLKNGVAP